jgi:hypothetical protein
LSLHIERSKALGQGQVVSAPFKVVLFRYLVHAAVAQRDIQHSVDLNSLVSGVFFPYRQQNIDRTGPIASSQELSGAVHKSLNAAEIGG